MDLFRLERRAMTGSLASTIAHDINNILTVGCASGDMLNSTEGLDAEQLELVKEINDSFSRLAEMARRLSTAGRIGIRADLQPSDLREVVTQAVEAIRQRPLFAPHQVELVAEQPVPMRLYAPMIHRLLDCLLTNAAEALAGTGRIQVQVRKETYSIVLEVHDSGPGVPAEQRAQIFDPFYTTKENHEGLGLLAAKAATQMHRGRMVVVDSPLGGLGIKITIPIEKPAV